MAKTRTEIDKEMMYRKIMPSAAKRIRWVMQGICMLMVLFRRHPPEWHGKQKALRRVCPVHRVLGP